MRPPSAPAPSASTARTVSGFGSVQEGGSGASSPSRPVVPCVFSTAPTSVFSSRKRVAASAFGASVSAADFAASAANTGAFAPLASRIGTSAPMRRSPRPSATPAAASRRSSEASSSAAGMDMAVASAG